MAAARAGPIRMAADGIGWRHAATGWAIENREH